MLDVLLSQGQSIREGALASVALEMELTCTLFRATHVVRALKVIGLHTRDCFLFFQTPHVVKQVVNASADGIVALVGEEWSACFEEIAHQVDVGSQEVVKTDFQAIECLCC